MIENRTKAEEIFAKRREKTLEKPPQQPIRPLDLEAGGAIKKLGGSLRESLAAMIELLASQRPDLLPVYLDMAGNSPVRVAILELVSEFDVREPTGLCEAALKTRTDLDRLEKRRGGWRHPQQVVTQPHIGALLYFCRARIQRVSNNGRRRRLEVLARKLERVREREKTMAWINNFIGSPGQVASGQQA